MSVNEVTTRLLAYLPDPYDRAPGSTNYGIMYSYATELDMAYMEISDLHTQVGVNTATNGYLDDLGYMFRIQRQIGETDDSLRARIKSYFVSFSGGGTAPSMIDAISLLTGEPTSTITIIDIPDIKFMVTFTVPLLGPMIGTVKDLVNNSKAAGTFAYFTVVNEFANEGMSLAESLTFSNNPFIIVSAYTVGSDAYV